MASNNKYKYINNDDKSPVKKEIVRFSSFKSSYVPLIRKQIET